MWIVPRVKRLRKRNVPVPQLTRDVNQRALDLAEEPQAKKAEYENKPTKRSHVAMLLLSQLCDLLEGPNVIRFTSRHHPGDPERLVNAAKL